MTWKTFRHRGVVFPPPFKATHQHSLKPLAEEMLVAWARQPKERQKDPVFCRNFLTDLKSLTGLGPYVGTLSLKLKLPPTVKDLSPTQKKQRQEDRAALKEQYGHVEIDGTPTPCSFGLEPAGIFVGRGQHPYRGRWKEAMRAEDIVLNLDAKAKVPPVPLAGLGTHWGGVVHETESYWIASWPCPVGIRGRKYLWTSELGTGRQSQDQVKYDKAVELGQIIERVRVEYSKRHWELWLAMLLIDQLGLRVGNEKSEGKSDTVGTTTLRCEHVHYNLDDQTLDLSFLGKDSVRLEAQIQPPRALFNKVVERLESAQGEDLLFPTIAASTVNQFLKSQMDGLTAKVFRTYHGTQAVRESLKKSPPSLWGAKYANLMAAKRLNHRRTLPKDYMAKVQAREDGPQKDFLLAAADYNLGTSLKNYIDPRVFVQWDPKRSWIKLYSKALRAKFAWALEGEIDATLE